MKRYLGTLLCVLGAAACSTNKPAESADGTIASSEPAYNDSAPMTPASADSATRTDGATHSDGSGAGHADHHATSGSTTNPTTGSTSTGSSNTASTGTGTGTSAAAAASNTTTNTADKSATTPAPSPATAPDNTDKNKRDSKGNSLTPIDQGNNDKDLSITQQIRQAVMGDGTLSFNAKNVKIITQNGKVTLRGPVASEQERAAIEAAARKVAGAGNVDNQIEVKK